MSVPSCSRADIARALESSAAVVARVSRAARLGAVVLLIGLQSAHGETLRDALLRAYQANPTLNAQRTSVLAIGENLPRAQAGYRPKVNLTSDIGHYSEADHYADGTRYGLVTNPRGVGLTLTQNVFDGFRTANSVRQAKSQISEARAATLRIEQDTLFAAVSAYMDVLADTAILDRVRRSTVALREQLRLARDRHGFGEVTKTDVAQVESRLAGAQAQGNVAEANLRTSIAKYRQVVGIDPSQLSPARSVEQLVPHTLDDTIKIALAENPAIHSASFGVNAAALQVDIVRGERLPTVTLSGLLSRRHDVTYRGDEQTSGSVVGRISIPLYEGGDIAARTSQAKHLASQRALEMDAIRDQVRAAAASSWGEFQAAKERAANAQQQLRAAETALTGMREQWSAGDRTMREVLDAEQEFLTAEVNLIVAQRDRIVASYAIARVIGKLTLSSLDGFPLTATGDRVFNAHRMPPNSKAAETRDRATCRSDCSKFAADWTLRRKTR